MGIIVNRHTHTHMYIYIYENKAFLYIVVPSSNAPSFFTSIFNSTCLYLYASIDVNRHTSTDSPYELILYDTHRIPPPLPPTKHKKRKKSIGLYNGGRGECEAWPANCAVLPIFFVGCVCMSPLPHVTHEECTQKKSQVYLPTAGSRSSPSLVETSFLHGMPGRCDWPVCLLSSAALRITTLTANGRVERLRFLFRLGWHVVQQKLPTTSRTYWISTPIKSQNPMDSRILGWCA